MAGTVFSTGNYADRSSECGHLLAAAQSGKKFRGNCGTALNGARFCGECGTPAA